MRDPAAHPTDAPVPDVLGATSAAYADACAAAGLHGGRSGAVERYRRFYREGRTDAIALGEPAAPVARTVASESSEGVVTKFTQKVPRGGIGEHIARGVAELETESVIIPMIGKKGVLTHTLCVSSQVGCAMGCTFCQTAQMGLIRSLTPREIVQQWWAARHLLGCETITNVVFMGMGEPMDNLEGVLGAVAVLTDHSGPGLPMSKISISTVGRVDGLAQLAAKVREPGWHRLNLAVSLNAPDDETRSKIMPVNRAMPLARLRDGIEAWPIYGAAKICLEYVLIPGVNDSREAARKLSDFVLGRGEWGGRPALPGLVNVIPYNPRDGSPWAAPEEESVVAFLGWLLEEGVYAKRRRTKGRDRMAACGQLGNAEVRRRAAALTVEGQE